MTDAPQNRLRDLRKARKWSLAKVAAAFDNVTEKTVYRWETEETSIPSDFIPTLSALFEVDHAELMGWDRQPTSTEQVRKAVA
jgi:transcriptional regulator with XRE-family HTH domain